MKKIFAVVLSLFFCFPIFAQSTNILDYFPADIGNSWTYANASGKTTDVITLKNNMPDQKDGTSLYLFEQQIIGMGTISSMKSVKNNKVVILTSKDALGRYRENSPPYPIELAPADQEWRYNDRGDDLRYKTSKASCSFDGKTYSDCILVEERIVDGSKILRTKKSYYAKGIGLVYVTLESPTEKERVFMKLVNCDIKVSNSVAIKESPLKDIAIYQAPPYPEDASSNLETYNFRISKEMDVPPTLIDTFICDIWTNLKYGLNVKAKPSTIDEETINTVINFYLNNKWTQLFGYRPWTHWNYIRVLSSTQRDQLVKEIAAFIKQNGVWNE